MAAAAFVLLASGGVIACGGAEEPQDEASVDPVEDVETTTQDLNWPGWPAPSGDAVGLALDVLDGVSAPVAVRAGQKFYINQIDIHTANLNLTTDQGVASLDQFGDFSKLDWRGTSLRDTSFTTQNQDGTFTRRRFYRDARWMQQASQIVLWQVDDHGRLLDFPTIVNLGRDDKRTVWDDFFIRRLRAIQWTYDCTTGQNCDAATKFGEEGLLEVRANRHPERTFKVHPRTAAFKLMWTLQGGRSYTIPVTQEQAPQFAYGFKVDVTPITPPQSDGTYAPGTNIEFELALRDGDGNRLNPAGTMPTFNDVLFGTATRDTGITYWNGLNEQFVTYYRRKHKERQLAAMITGPAQDIQPIRSYLEVEDFIVGDVFQTSQYAVDGIFSQARSFPAFSEIFAGDWSKPQTDKFTFYLPADARPGTYYVTTKARRVYLGEEIAVTSQVKVQVGTPTVTTATLNVGNCSNCHNSGGELTKVAHGNDNLATCNACHTPLFNEPEGPVYVRTHYIHSRSDRFDAPLNECKQCHTNTAGIQRTSKSACLSCHNSYPDWHVVQFGPITDNFVGGGRESFQQCTQSCHTNHPGSGLL